MKKRVLVMLAAFDKGGIEKVTLDLVNNLDPEKYDITVYTLWYGGSCQSKVNKDVKVKPFFFKRYVRGIIRLVDILSPKMLYRLFIRGKYDIEIAAGDGECSKIIAGSPNKNSRKISWIHMDVLKRGSQMREFNDGKTGREIYKKFDKILCVSKACMDSFLEKFGDFDSLAVAYNPMPKDEIIEKSNERIEDVAFDKDTFNFITVGRLVWEKGYDVLIESCRKLIKEDGKNFKVYIIGDGPVKEELEKQISDYGLEDNVILLGYRDNPYKYVKEADAYIMSSRMESFSLCIGEAIITHTVVVATECSGVREWLSDSEYGLVVENSFDGICEGMTRIVEDKELYNSYKGKVIEREQLIDFEKTFNELEEYING